MLKQLKLGETRLGAVVGALAMVAALGALIASGHSDDATLVDADPLVATGEATTADDDGNAATEQASVETSVFAIGDRVALGDWELIVHSVTDPLDATDAIVAPDEGNRWVAVDVEVFYNGAEPQSVSSLLCFEIQDSENRTHDQSIFADGNFGTIDGEIAPGTARRGGIVYEVPDTATGFRLNFKCDLFSSGSATVQLS